MKKYQYQIVKYVHDHFTAEFVNIGVVIYSPENSFLDCKMLSKHTRITSMFPHANGKFIESILRSFEKHIELTAPSLKELFTPSVELNKITEKIIARDNSAIQFSAVKKALDVDLNSALENLYFELVEKYTLKPTEKKSLTDQEVWQKKYKSYFDKYHISHRLTAHKLNTSNDVFKFEKAWKNNVWHIYQPLSFSLQEKEAIKEKVYKWVGKLQELRTAKHELHITFLTSLENKHRDLDSFIHEYLEVKNETLNVEVVNESEAENLAKRVKKEMEKHDNEEN